MKIGDLGDRRSIRTEKPLFIGSTPIAVSNKNEIRLLHAQGLFTLRRLGFRSEFPWSWSLKDIGQRSHP